MYDWHLNANCTNPHVKATRSLISEEGLTLFPITEMDQFLRGVITGSDHMLSHDGVWDYVPSGLEINALSRTSTYDRYFRQFKVAFDVPIIGHLLLSKHDDGRQPLVRQRFMRWNGKLYDKSFLYTLRADGGSFMLREYGPLDVRIPDFPDRKISRLNVKIRDFCKSFPTGSAFRLHHGRDNIRHTSSYRSTESAEAGRAGILIDLHRPMYVSHIGTMGDAPSASLFPKLPAAAFGGQGKAGRALARKRKACKKRARGDHVYVVDEQVSLSASAELPHSRSWSVAGAWGALAILCYLWLFARDFALSPPPPPAPSRCS
jgi:hypothetical protein